MLLRVLTLNFGDYYLVVSDVNGCTVTQSQTLNWLLDIGLDVESIVPACFAQCDGEITFVPNESSNAFSFDDWFLYYSLADIDGDGIPDGTNITMCTPNHTGYSSHVDMAFNMGVPRLCKFKKMWAAV